MGHDLALSRTQSDNSGPLKEAAQQRHSAPGAWGDFGFGDSASCDDYFLEPSACHLAQANSTAEQ